MSHTPGPWEYQEESDGYTHIVRGPRRNIVHQGPQRTDGEAEANARLIAAAPELEAAGLAMNHVITKALQILMNYLPPDSGVTPDDAINELLGLFDGPKQREAQDLWKTAIAKAEAR